MSAPVGVAVLSYGSPAGPDEVEAYLTHIRHGRAPTAEALADLERRYEAIGGISPFRERTARQEEAMRRALDAAAPGRCAVAGGYKHAPPFVEDAVATLTDAGVERIVGVVLAPHESALSVGEYATRLAAAAEAAGRPHAMVRSWWDLPAHLDFLAGAVREALARTPARTKVLFTAHSLPARIVDAGDPYPDQLQATAQAVAARVGLDRWSGWATAWQSAAPSPEPWLGPDVGEVIELLGETGRAEGVVVCPCGFTTEHLEIRYDLDVVAAGRAEAAGLAFARTRLVEDDPATFAELAGRVLATAGDATDPTADAAPGAASPAEPGPGGPGGR